MADPGGLQPPGPEPGRKIWLDSWGQSVSELLITHILQSAPLLRAIFALNRHENTDNGVDPSWARCYFLKVTPQLRYLATLQGNF
jgi:hypothetical protein